MIMGNVSERRKQPPQVGVSVVILALGPASHGTQEHARTSAGSTLWIPLVRRVRQPFLGQWALPGGGLRADHSLEQSAYVALESTTSLHPRYLEQLYTFGDTALRADTAEPAGANGDNAGTGAFGAEQHTRGTGAENTGLFCAEGYGRADRAGNADCPCGADTGGKRGKEGCL